jgi:MoaA/NifB/PqqE/SkfB family radical SAM enzyme
MSVDTFVQILDRFPRAIAVGLGGGEPLLNNRALDMVEIAQARRMKVHVFTNGTTLSDSISSVLAAPIEFLNISLYGVDGESFAERTGADAALFHDIIEAVAELSKRRARGGYPRVVRTSFICIKKSMSSAFDFIRISEQLGVDAAKLRNLHLYGIPGYDESQCLFEDDPEVQEFMGMLRSRTYRIPVYTPRLYQRTYSPRRCVAPYHQLNVGGDGSIGPCCVVGPDKRWGSILDPDIWNGQTLTDLRRNLRNDLCALPPACLTCEQMIPERARI